jgi:hypothetical protein
MTPATAWALIILNGGQFNVTDGMTERACFARAMSQDNLWACFEYVPGAPGYTLFVDAGYRQNILSMHKAGEAYPDLAACEANGSQFRDDIPRVCLPLAAPAKPCILSMR